MGVGRKTSRREEAMENQDREIEPISFPLLYQWWVKGRNGHTQRAHRKGTLPCVKIEDLFWRNAHFQENAHHLFRKFQPIFVRKNIVLGSITYLLTSSTAMRTKMVRESLDVFTKRMLGYALQPYNFTWHTYLPEGMYCYCISLSSLIKQ